MERGMSGYVSMKHDPPQVLTVVAITCRTCLGEQSYDDQDGRLCACHICENGYEKVMVPFAIVMGIHTANAGRPDIIHAAIAAYAEHAAVRLPVLTHNTSLLPVHLLPTRRRIPLLAPEKAA